MLPDTLDCSKKLIQQQFECLVEANTNGGAKAKTHAVRKPFDFNFGDLLRNCTVPNIRANASMYKGELLAFSAPVKFDLTGALVYSSGWEAANATECESSRWINCSLGTTSCLDWVDIQ